MEFITAIYTNHQEIITQALIAIGGVTVFLGALYKIFLLIPGDQPEKTIKKFYDFTKKYSR